MIDFKAPQEYGDACIIKLNTMEKQNKIHLYNDGFSVKLHNRKAMALLKDGQINLCFLNLSEDPEKPACKHSVLRGKVRQTNIKLSIESFQALIEGYYEFIKKNKKT